MPGQNGARSNIQEIHLVGNTPAIFSSIRFARALAHVKFNHVQWSVFQSDPLPVFIISLEVQNPSKKCRNREKEGVTQKREFGFS